MDEKRRFTFNAHYAIEGLYFLSLFWLGYNLLVFIPQRPAEMFSPMSYFGRMFCPTMPSPAYYLVIFILAFASNLLLLSKRFKNVLSLRILHIFCLLWINNLKWSFGFLSHVDHLFLLSFILSLFIKRQLPITDNEVQLKSKAYSLYFSGLLVTYTMSAFWKVYYVIVNLLKHHPGYDWTAPKALLYTAATGHILMGQSFDWQAKFLSMTYFADPLLWGMTTIMLLAFMSVLNYKYFRFTLMCLILFHLANTIFILAVFWLSPAILILFLLPYHKIMAQKYFSYNN